MTKRQRFNLLFVVLGVMLLPIVQTWRAVQKIEILPYSEFERLRIEPAWIGFGGTAAVVPSMGLFLGWTARRAGERTAL